MNWIESLYQTYENCVEKIGDDNEKSPLMPICHTTLSTQVEIVLDKQGEFRRASVVPKDDASTLIPATESSAGRTGSKVAPHPLCDKLQYVAGDYGEFVDAKKARFDAYITQLNEWCNSPFAHPKVRIVRDYVQKKCLIRDLIQAKILYADESGKLLQSWDGDKDDRPDIFGVIPGTQSDVVVRFAVEIPNEPDSKLWKDRSVWASWTDYYSQIGGEESLCYVTGREMLIAKNHPAKIRNSGDRAKLISSNDSSGFTFRGQFTDDDGSQACGVSFEVSQKAHNALRWLIACQGWRNGDLAFVAWAVSGVHIPDPMLDSSDLWEAEIEAAEVEPETTTSDTAQDIGRKVASLLKGYSAKLGNTDNVVVMGLNSSTPGRLAIIFYRQLTGSEFLERVQAWHTQCSWFQRFKKDKKFVGAPAPKDIAKAAYGNEVDTKLCNATVERIIPCIIDGFPIPRDLVESTTRRACNRHGLDPWEWEKTLGIACSLYKYFHKKEEEYMMALDRTRKSKDYLYGRLLAVADCLEGFALSEVEKGRPTNAARLMQRFANHPCSTWRTIELALTPYKARLEHKVKKYDDELQQIMNLFDPDEFIKDDTPLTGEFLLGFHSQRAELYKKSSKPDTNNEEELEEAAL